MKLFVSPGCKWVGLLAGATVLAGCATIKDGGESQAGRIKIISEPAGAVAYADGSELGTTPLEIVPGNYFRSGFVGLSYRYYGKLTLKKAGCETWSTEVDDAILLKDVHARLKCDPDYRSAPATVPSGTASDAMPNPASGNHYVERLERIEILHKKGLISDEEYRRLRARILEKL